MDRKQASKHMYENDMDFYHQNKERIKLIETYFKNKNARIEDASKSINFDDKANIILSKINEINEAYKTLSKGHFAFFLAELEDQFYSFPEFFNDSKKYYCKLMDIESIEVNEIELALRIKNEYRIEKKIHKNELNEFILKKLIEEYLQNSDSSCDLTVVEEIDKKITKCKCMDNKERRNIESKSNFFDEVQDNAIRLSENMGELASKKLLDQLIVHEDIVNTLEKKEEKNVSIDQIRIKKSLSNELKRVHSKIVRQNHTLSPLTDDGKDMDYNYYKTDYKTLQKLIEYFRKEVSK